MQYTKYIAPPKLKSDFLLGGLTLTELLIGLGLLFLFFSVSVKMAFIVVGIWVVFNVRLYEGRSIRTYLGIIIRYHMEWRGCWVRCGRCCKFGMRKF